MIVDAQTNGTTFPDQGEEDKRPDSDLESHYDDPEVRWMEIKRAAKKAAVKSIEKGRDYIVVEYFRPSRETEPLGIQPAYMDVHQNAIVVFQAHAPTQTYPIKVTSKKPTARAQRV
jgi:hypothetical protein